MRSPRKRKSARSLKLGLDSILDANEIKLRNAGSGTQRPTIALPFKAVKKQLLLIKFASASSALDLENRYRQWGVSNFRNLSAFGGPLQASTIAISCAEVAEKKGILPKSTIGTPNACYTEKQRQVSSTDSQVAGVAFVKTISAFRKSNPYKFWAAQKTGSHELS